VQQPLADLLAMHCKRLHWEVGRGGAEHLAAKLAGADKERAALLVRFMIDL
jgi:hypothetical protein